MNTEQDLVKQMKAVMSDSVADMLYFDRKEDREFGLDDLAKLKEVGGDYARDSLGMFLLDKFNKGWDAV